MTKPQSFGTVRSIAHPNLTSGLLISKYDLPIGRRELSRYLHELDGLSGSDPTGIANKFDRSNGFTLLMSPTLVDDQVSPQNPSNERRFSPPQSTSKERLAFIFDNGEAFVIEFSLAFIQHFHMANGHPNGANHTYQGVQSQFVPGGFAGTAGVPGNFGFQGPPPGRHHLDFILGLLKYAATKETQDGDHMGFAK